LIVARKPVSIGDWVLAPGETLSREMQMALPPGRLQQMITQHWLEEIVDTVVEARERDDLAFRVEKLERTVGQLLAMQQRASTAAAKTAPKKET